MTTKKKKAKSLAQLVSQWHRIKRYVRERGWWWHYYKTYAKYNVRMQDYVGGGIIYYFSSRYGLECIDKKKANKKVPREIYMY